MTKPRTRPRVKTVQNDDVDEYKLDQIDKLIIPILLEFPAITNEELGKQVGLSANAVVRRRKRPAFDKAWERAVEPVEDILRRSLAIAARKLLELTKSDDKRIALEAAKVLLGPILNRVSIDHTIHQTVKVFKTEVRSDGALVRSMVEELMEQDIARPDPEVGGER